MNKIPLIKYEQLPYKEYNNGINCRYSIKIGQFYSLNQDGSRTKGNVYLKDNKTPPLFLEKLVKLLPDQTVNSSVIGMCIHLLLQYHLSH